MNTLLVFYINENHVYIYNSIQLNNQNIKEYNTPYPLLLASKISSFSNYNQFLTFGFSENGIALYNIEPFLCLSLNTLSKSKVTSINIDKKYIWSQNAEGLMFLYEYRHNLKVKSFSSKLNEKVVSVKSISNSLLYVIETVNEILFYDTDLGGFVSKSEYFDTV